MIELNKKTQRDFLNREWVQKLLDAGVDMSDAKYMIAKDKLSMHDDEPDLSDYVWGKNSTAEVYDIIPTYTVSELFYKLYKWVVSREGRKQGGLIITKGQLLNSLLSELSESFCHYIQCQDATYIKSLAMLLIQCHKRDIGIKAKDTGNINDK